MNRIENENPQRIADRATIGSSEQRRADLERLEPFVVQRLGRPARRIDRIEAGLGTRRFYRVELDGGAPNRVIARIEPSPEPEPTRRPAAPHVWLLEPPLEPIRAFLEDAGLPVPKSFGHDAGLGIDLLEDVGRRTLLDVDAESLRDRYLEAGRLVPRLQGLDPSSQDLPACTRRYDLALVRTKTWKFIHWAWPGLLGREATDTERETIESGFAELGAMLVSAPQRLSHRDFKAENLHLAAGTNAREELVMIDVQGAFMAPPEYDLVCLLRDLQVDLPESLVEQTFETIQPTLPDRTDAALARIRFDALAVLRLAKDVAHLVDAGLYRGDRRRWHEIPRGLRLLDRSVKTLEGPFSGIRALSSVIETLTRTAGSSDISTSRQGER
jgi:aminoglycoside/choline kinase family phosphotransferase